MNTSTLAAVLCAGLLCLGCERPKTTSGIEPAYNDVTGQLSGVFGSQAGPSEPKDFDNLECIPISEVGSAAAVQDPEIVGGSICFVAAHHHM